MTERSSGDTASAVSVVPSASGMAWIVAGALAFGICLISLIVSVEVPVLLGWPLLTEQAVALILGFAIAIVFLKDVAKAGSRSAASVWIDVLAAALGAGVGVYLFIRYSVLALEFYYHPVETFVIGAVLLPLIIEALRRTTGWSLVVVVFVFLAYALYGHLVPGQLEGRSQEFTKLVSFLSVDNVAVLGLPLVIVGTVVISFVFMGQLLLRSGGSDWFTSLAAALMGRSRGGSGKIAILASALFGSISGSAVANVAATGVLTIPLMLKAGFKPRMAGAVEAVASTGGQVMPPIMSAAGFLMAEFLEIPYSEVMLAALIPAFLYYFSAFLQVDLEAARNNIPSVPKEQIPEIGKVLREGWFFAVPFVLLIVMLFLFNRSPAESAVWAAVVMAAIGLMAGYKGRRLTLRDIGRCFAETGQSSVDIVIVAAMAGIVIGVIDTTGAGFGLTFVLLEIGAGNGIALLFLTAITCIILGMGMPTAALYLLVATLVAPPLIEAGVDPLAAHLFVLYFGLMSMITPPVAMAAYTAANLAGARPLDTAISAMRLGWPAFVVPFLFALSPTLIMQGTPFHVATAVLTAIGGIWLVTGGLMGYLVAPLGRLVRLLLVVAGLALLVPPQMGEGGVYINVLGFILGGAIIGRQALRRVFQSFGRVE